MTWPATIAHHPEKYGDNTGLNVNFTFGPRAVSDSQVSYDEGYTDGQAAAPIEGQLWPRGSYNGA